jgi:hypothetical protein
MDANIGEKIFLPHPTLQIMGQASTCISAERSSLVTQGHSSWQVADSLERGH